MTDPATPSPTQAIMNATLAELDPDIADVLDRELGRQRDYLEMIASENFVPRAVLQAQGSVLTNKYAEGYPGRRYYGGCDEVVTALSEFPRSCSSKFPRSRCQVSAGSCRL